MYNFRLNLARALKNEGYKVVCVAPYDALYTPQIEKEFPFYAIPFDAKGINPFADLKTMWLLYRLFRKLKPDVVLNYTIKPNLYGTWVASLVGAKSINNISGLGTVFIHRSLLTSLVKLLYRFTLHVTCKVFFQNKDDFTLFCSEKLVNPLRAEVISGSGVDLKRFYPQLAHKQHEKIIFLLVARMLKDKGIYEFIEASQKLYLLNSAIECWLLGACDVHNKTAISKEEIETLCARVPLRYLGTSDSVEAVIGKADCVVLPSYREGTPRSLLEAAAMAKPIITTDAVGCKDVVEDGITGFLCQRNDSDDLMKKMAQMASLSNEQRIHMGKMGHEKIKKEYDEVIVIKCYLKAIKELLFYN